MNSVDDYYGVGYQQGYDYGHDVGWESGIEQALQCQIATLCDFIAMNPWLWKRGDGFGGWIKQELEDAFDHWEFPKKPRNATPGRTNRKPLRASEIIAAMSQSDGKCVACGATEELQVDHIMPVSRGGTNDIENLQMLCRSCNASKRDKTMEEWQGEAA